MNILSKISPPATLLLITTSARMKGLLKLTLMDLVLKGVLRLEIKAQKLDQARRKIAVWYVIQGRNFSKYRPKPYEIIFLKEFFETPMIRILFRDLVRVGFQNAKGIDLFKRSVIKSEGLEKYIKSSLIQRIYGGHSLTSEGLAVQKQIKNYIFELNRNIAHYIQNDKKLALQTLINLRGNILLLTNIKFSMLKSIEYELLKQEMTFDYPDDWVFYESMFEESQWLDYFDLTYL